MNDETEGTEAEQVDGSRYVLLDRAGLDRLPAEERFAACQNILKYTIHPAAREVMEEAVTELLAEYGDAYGANAAVARRLGISPTYVGQIAKNARANAETREQALARLDRETVEDYTAHPNARLRAVEGTATMVETFLGATVEAAIREDWEQVAAGLLAIESDVRFTLDTVLGRTNPELVAEAEQIKAGEAPWQQHTYRRRVTFSDDGQTWVEHSDAPWKADNDQTIEEVAEDSGYQVTNIYDRMGEYTPGRLWKVELWRDEAATGGPGHMHEHVEDEPSERDRAIARAITEGRVVRDGKIDKDLMLEFLRSGMADTGADETGGQP